MTTIFFSRMLGPALMIIGLGVLLNRKIYRKVMKDFSKNAALVYLGGVFALFLGLVIVLFHNVWEASLAVIITNYGWGGIVKGAWLIMFPKSVAKFTDAYVGKKTLLAVHLVIVVILGGLLTYAGYFA